MDGRKIYEVIIIGGGPAGLTAGIYCKRAVLDAVLLEKGLIGGQLAISKEVENYPGLQGITGFDLVEKMVHHAESYKLQIINEEASAVLAGTDYHSVRLANGETLQATALILAEGGSVRKLGVPGEAEYLGTGVSYCATCDGFFFRDKTVVVVGGGDTAVEEALYLSKLAKKVYLVHRGNTLKASRLLQDRLMNGPGTEIIWNTVVSEIRGNGTSVEGVKTEDLETGKKREIPADGVFIFIGYAPNNALVPPEIKKNDRGFIITDEKCETNVPGIFAAGDIRQKFANQIVVAASDGCISALAAAHYIGTHKK